MRKPSDLRYFNANVLSTVPYYCEIVLHLGWCQGSLGVRRSSGYVHKDVKRIPSKICNAHVRNHGRFVHKYSSEL